MAVIYTFRGELSLTGALHIGSGGGDANTDATIVRDSIGRPYIPGSSLRGALRAAIERLAPTLLGIDPPRDMRDQRSDSISDHRKTLRDLEQQLEGKSEEEIRDILKKELTEIERLFGTTLWASPLLIPDLPLVKGAPEAGEVRHGVGIDRDTGAAREQIKYDFEVLPRGHTFHLLMRCEMEPKYQQVWSRLLTIGLRLLQQGELTLGGRAARGVGQVRLTKLDVFRLDTNDRPTLLAALLSTHDAEARYGTRETGDWVKRTLEQI